MKKSNRCNTLRLSNGAPFNGENQVELRQLLTALTAFKRGDFSVRLPADWTGLAGKVADTFNDVISINHRKSRELERIGRDACHARSGHGRHSRGSGEGQRCRRAMAGCD